MKGKIYVLLSLTIDTGDKTPKEAIVDEIAASGKSAIYVQSGIIPITDFDIIEVGSSLKEIRQ